MNFTSICAWLSTAIAIYCTIPYVIAVLKGKTKPHQLSWLVFVIMNAIVFGSQFLEGGRGSTLIALAFTVGSLIIFLLSFKYGTRDTSRWDKLLFTFALLTIIAWLLTRSNATAIWLTVIIDVAATAMIILKLRTRPNTEAAFPWVLGTLAYAFSCLSLAGTPLNILYVRPVYGLLCDAVLVLAILYYQKRGTMKVTASPASL
jgi:hypothetical protein